MNASDADANEDVALEHVKRSGDPITDPVGFLTEPVDVARFGRLLLTFERNFVRGFAGDRPLLFILRLGRTELRCQNLRGVSTEDLPGAGAAKAKVTDFANVAVRKTHSDIRIPLAWG